MHHWQRTHERYLLKPMNCPHHCQIFKAQPRSYRQLPLRLFEFGTVYRHEQTGELNGMLRVRGLTQDDAHIFCTADQVEEEFRNTIELTKFVLESVGLDDYRVQLSLRDPDSDKYVGSEENWDRAEACASRACWKKPVWSLTKSREKPPFTDPRPTSWCVIASVARGNSARSSSTTTCPNDSSWNTTAATMRPIDR